MEIQQSSRPSSSIEAKEEVRKSERVATISSTSKDSKKQHWWSRQKKQSVKPMSLQPISNTTEVSNVDLPATPQEVPDGLEMEGMSNAVISAPASSYTAEDAFREYFQLALSFGADVDGCSCLGMSNKSKLSIVNILNDQKITKDPHCAAIVAYVKNELGEATEHKSYSAHNHETGVLVLSAGKYYDFFENMANLIMEDLSHRNVMDPDYNARSDALHSLLKAHDMAGKRRLAASLGYNNEENLNKLDYMLDYAKIVKENILGTSTQNVSVLKSLLFGKPEEMFATFSPFDINFTLENVRIAQEILSDPVTQDQFMQMLTYREAVNIIKHDNGFRILDKAPQHVVPKPKDGEVSVDRIFNEGKYENRLPMSFVRKEDAPKSRIKQYDDSIENELSFHSNDLQDISQDAFNNGVGSMVLKPDTLTQVGSNPQSLQEKNEITRKQHLDSALGDLGSPDRIMPGFIRHPNMLQQHTSTPLVSETSSVVSSRHVSAVSSVAPTSYVHTVPVSSSRGSTEVKQHIPSLQKVEPAEHITTMACNEMTPKTKDNYAQLVQELNKVVPTKKPNDSVDEHNLSNVQQLNGDDSVSNSLPSPKNQDTKLKKFSGSLGIINK